MVSTALPLPAICVGAALTGQLLDTRAVATVSESTVPLGVGAAASGCAVARENERKRAERKRAADNLEADKEKRANDPNYDAEVKRKKREKRAAQRAAK